MHKMQNEAQFQCLIFVVMQPIKLKSLIVVFLLLLLLLLLLVYTFEDWSTYANNNDTTYSVYSCDVGY